MTEPPQPYATPRNYDALVAALDRRRIELGWSHVDLDQITGCATGQTGKAFGPSQTKKLGWKTTWEYIDALGFDLVLAVNHEKTARYAARAITGNPKQARKNNYAQRPGRRAVSRVMRHLSGKAIKVRKANPDHIDQCRQAASRGGMVTASRLTRKERRALARRAATIRWNDVRSAARAAAQRAQESAHRRQAADTGEATSQVSVPLPVRQASGLDV